MFLRVFILMVMSISLYGGNEASFPKEWASYEKVTTLLSQKMKIPQCDTDISTFAPIYQEMIYTYCGLGDGRVEILVSPKAKKAFERRDGNYPDMTEFILHLKDIKTLFVTTYKDNKPLYSIYSEEGEDVSSSAGTGLNSNDCRSCHTGYSAFCLNGQCGTYE